MARHCRTCGNTTDDCICGDDDDTLYPVPGPASGDDPDDTVWRLPREGQVSVRAERVGVEARQCRLTAIVPAPEFRPYRWRERPRRPVCSPEVAAMLAITAADGGGQGDGG